MDVSVIVATYGDAHWMRLGDRAEASVPKGVPVVRYHGNALHHARNQALRLVDTEWVVHLDADDELEGGYIEAMAAADADVRGPIARYCGPGRRERIWEPKVAGHTHHCTAECLPLGNWLLIGSAVRTQAVRDAGGWRDFPWSEDWDLWLRCWLQGATFQLVPDAIYRAHVRLDSRNRGATQAAKAAAHEAIYQANFGEGARAAG